MFNPKSSFDSSETFRPDTSPFLLKSQEDRPLETGGLLNILEMEKKSAYQRILEIMCANRFPVKFCTKTFPYT